MLKYIFLFFFAMILHSSCVKEDLEACKQESYLMFYYKLNPLNENIFGNSVSKIDVYIFDSNGKFVMHKSDSGAHITNDYRMPLNLSDGIYSFISIGGHHINNSKGLYDQFSPLDNFNTDLIVGESHIDDFRIKSKELEDNTDNPEIGDWIVGNSRNVEVSAQKFQEVSIELINNVNHIDLEIVGLDHLNFKAILIADNARYNFDNNTPEEAKIISYNAGKENRLANDHHLFDILRMYIHTPVFLKLLDDNNNNALPGFESLNIVEEILKSPAYNNQTDLDRENQYKIKIFFKDSIITNITINGWSVTGTIPEA